MFSVCRTTFCTSATPERFALISLPLKVIAPTVAVPLITVTAPEVTGVSKVKTAGVVARDAIFTSRRAAEWHVDVERAGSSLGHTRSRADQASWGARAVADTTADQAGDLDGVCRTRG